MRPGERFRIPHVVIDYGELKSNPEAAKERIERCFDLKLDLATLNYSPGLDHATPVGRAKTSLYLALKRTKSALEKTPPYRALKRARNRFRG
jgi:hypothetical protein